MSCNGNCNQGRTCDCIGTISSIPDRMVILQSNGIIRDENHVFIGRLVEDVDALCEEHRERGRIVGMQQERALWEMTANGQELGLYNGVDEYLKDGETVAECIARNRKDVSTTLTLLAKCKGEKEALQQKQTFCKHGVPRGVCRLGEKDCD